MVAQKLTLNSARIKKMSDDQYLITCGTGNFVVVDKKAYKSLFINKEISDKRLYEQLEEKQIIITPKNKNKVLKSYQKKKSFLFIGPTLHIIVPTLRCNLSCIYCHASSVDAGRQGFDMSKTTAKQVVDFIFESPSKSITIEFQGGEPLMAYELVKFITLYARKKAKIFDKDLNLSLVSNLTLMDPQKLNFFIKNRVSICTSLDGPEHLHNKNRPYNSGAGSYSEVVKWIKYIKEEYKKRNIRENVNALLTTTSFSLNYAKEIVDEYVSYNIPSLHIRYLNNLGDARPLWNDISYTPEQFIKFWKEGVDYMLNLNKKGVEINERMVTIILRKIFDEYDPGYLDLRSPCGAVIGQLLYNYDGSIYTCDEGRMLGEDIFKVGQIGKDTYKDVLTSNQTCSIIDASINDSYVCDNCAYKPYCGLCPVCNYAETGSVITNVVNSDRCKILKAQFDYVFDKLLNDKEAEKIFLKWARVTV